MGYWERGSRAGLAIRGVLTTRTTSVKAACFRAAERQERSKMQQGDGVEAEVTWEDQQNINSFGRLNAKFHELEDEIKAKKEMAENLEDASNELVLSDEEVVRYQIGEVFSHLSKDEIESRLETLKEESGKELARLEEEKQEVVAQMVELKNILYGKFKDSINLEEK